MYGALKAGKGDSYLAPCPKELTRQADNIQATEAERLPHKSKVGNLVILALYSDAFNYTVM